MQIYRRASILAELAMGKKIDDDPLAWWCLTEQIVALTELEKADG
jgi:hypothetical protein